MKKDHAGKVFDYLTAVEFVRNDKTSGGQNRTIYKFKCKCGSFVEKRLADVSSGRVRSCGCKPSPQKHGGAVGKVLSAEYRSYRNMLTRTRNPNINRAGRYVGRNIAVCPEWLPENGGFQSFLQCVGPRPSLKHSLDRIDNNGNYEPGNVRWATQLEQVQNRECSAILEYGGKSKSLSEWASEFRLPYATLRDRLFKLKWPIERALLSPLRPDRRRKEADP